MRTILAIAVLLAVAGLGLWLLRLHLRRRHLPMAIGAHVLLGFAAFESMVVHIQQAGEGAGARLGGQVALGLMGVALGLGLATPLLAKDSRPRRNLMLAAHAGVGATAILLALLWVTGAATAAG